SRRPPTHAPAFDRIAPRVVRPSAATGRCPSRRSPRPRPPPFRGPCRSRIPRSSAIQFVRQTQNRNSFTGSELGNENNGAELGNEYKREQYGLFQRRIFHPVGLAI